MLHMDTIPINLKERSYNIKIGSGLLKQLDLSRFGANQFVIITDNNVRSLFGDTLK